MSPGLSEAPRDLPVHGSLDRGRQRTFELGMAALQKVLAVDGQREPFHGAPRELRVESQIVRNRRSKGSDVVGRQVQFDLLRKLKEGAQLELMSRSPALPDIQMRSQAAVRRSFLFKERVAKREVPVRSDGIGNEELRTLRLPARGVGDRQRNDHPSG